MALASTRLLVVPPFKSMSLPSGLRQISTHGAPSWNRATFPASLHRCTRSFQLKPVSAVTVPRPKSRAASSEQKAKDLNQQGIDEALSEFDEAVVNDQDKQLRAPWHREGVAVP